MICLFDVIGRKWRNLTQSLREAIIANVIGGTITGIIVGIPMFYYEQHVSGAEQNEAMAQAQQKLLRDFYKRVGGYCREWDRIRESVLIGAADQATSMELLNIPVAALAGDAMPESERTDWDAAVSKFQRDFNQFQILGVRYFFARTSGSAISGIDQDSAASHMNGAKVLDASLAAYCSLMPKNAK